MTENTGNELGSALFSHIRQIVNGRGVDIIQQQNGNSLKLEFADGQRILVNFNAQTHGVWLAARSGGIEFAHHHGNWRAHDQSDFFSKLHETIEQTIASNPLNARAPGTRTPHVERPATVIYHEEAQSHLLRNLLILLLAGVLGFWAALRMVQPPAAGNSDRPMQTLALGNADTNQTCEADYPANGNITVFGSGLRTDGPNDPEITLKNDHAFPMLMILSAPRSAIPALSVLIRARQSTTLHLPAGQYDMMFSSGNAWCNPRKGFSDGHLVKFEQALSVQMDKPMQLAMQSSGAGASDFQLFVHTETPQIELPKPTFTGDGSMEVKRATNGHFYLPGSIENEPVTFMVDTGATVTSISSSVARQAGIHGCKEVQFQTANGAAAGCLALVSRMTLGNFTLQNITVAVMPNMEINLLGANVLRNFQVSQNDSGMLIGLR
ncbi:MAG: TIGR02281 family clan AA aspartic protease [Sideroxydans sp.]|nr:TIGR02281 family clan AA aspartic protease [Sideroxydans sp.]